MNVKLLRPISSADACAACPACKSGPCHHLDSVARARLSTRSTVTRFARGTEILSQGAPASRVGIVVSGLVKVAAIDEDGTETVLQLLNRGGILGDPFAAENAFGCEAATDAQVCWTSPEALAEVAAEHPGTDRGYFESFLSQIREQQQFSVAMKGRSATERLAYWLLIQAPQASGSTPMRFEIVLTRRDLASMLGMTVETLCRALHRLQSRHAIRIQTSELLEITDLTRLRILAKDRDDALGKPRREWGARAIRPDRVPIGDVRGVAAVSVAPDRLGSDRRHCG